MKRFINIIAILLILTFSMSLYSCDREYDEKEVLAAAKVLIEKSYKLNELFYGKGLEYTDDENSVGVYKLATQDSLNEYGISTVEDMKNMAREIFSDSYCNVIFNSDIFTSTKVNNELTSYARYYQQYDKDGNASGIMVRSTYDYRLVGTYTYHEQMQVVDVIEQVIVVRALVTAQDLDGNTKNVNVDISMIEESDGWKLTTSTYVVYNGYSDLYDDLINNK